MANEDRILRLDKYRLALKLAGLIDDQCVTAKEIEEVFEQTSQILKIKYANSQPKEITID